MNNLYTISNEFIQVKVEVKNINNVLSPNTHTHTRARKQNLFSRTFCTSREYDDYGYRNIEEMANTWSAISRLQMDEIEKIQRRFQEYDFDFKISNWATHITCSTFLLLTASFLSIFYEIGNLKKNLWKCVFVNFKGCIWKLHLSALIWFFLFL